MNLDIFSVHHTHTISDSQHEFCCGKSCLTNLMESLNDWTAALDHGYAVDIFYLDYQKTFDIVPHT